MSNRRIGQTDLPPEIAKLRVAIVHDWLVRMGGAERCLEVMCDMFSDVDVFTLVHVPGSVSNVIEDRIRSTSSWSKVPGIRHLYPHLLPLFPCAVEGWSFEEYDLVISSSWCCAKGVVTRGVPHVAYVYTPMRYAWDQYQTYFGRSACRSFGMRRFYELIFHGLRVWDVASGQRPDAVVSISEFVAERVKRFWGRDSSVVYPPVGVVGRGGALGRKREIAQQREEFFLLVSTFEPNKHAETAIDACEEMGVRLKVVGGMGRRGRRIRRRAGGQVEFLGRISDTDLHGLMSRARAIISPGVEDFGIVPVEGWSVGTPVIALDAGGASELVQDIDQSDSPNGILYSENSTESLVGAVSRFIEFDENKSWDREAMKEYAQTFSEERFIKEFSETVLSLLQKLNQ